MRLPEAVSRDDARSASDRIKDDVLAALMGRPVVEHWLAARGETPARIGAWRPRTAWTRRIR